MKGGQTIAHPTWLVYYSMRDKPKLKQLSSQQLQGENYDYHY